MWDPAFINQGMIITQAVAVFRGQGCMVHLLEVGLKVIYYYVLRLR